MTKIKVLVTGAAGHIGYALVFRIASGQMFGSNTEIELSLLELEHALPAAEGVIMELQDCAFPLLKSVSCTADVNKACEGVNVALLVGSVPRKAGMERADLLKINGGVFTVQGNALNKNAASDVTVFVVGNPCNTNCLIAMNNAPDIPNERFFAMTMLDENRARALLASKANVDVTAVTNTTIWGNHSATQYPDFYNTLVNNKPLTDTIKDENWLQNDFITTVQQRGAAIIKARGSSSAASAANAIIDGIVSLRNDTAPGLSYSMCCHSQGQYGVDEGLIFSFPCHTKNGTLEVIEGIEHNTFGKNKFQLTLDELREERDTVKTLGLI